MQSRKMSIVETCVSTAIGYSVATAANYYVLPLFGYNVTLADASHIGIIMTLISLVRGYFVRRFFNWLQYRKLVTQWGKHKPAGIPMKSWIENIKNG
jgi:hypothetical protein